MSPADRQTRDPEDLQWLQRNERRLAGYLPQPDLRLMVRVDFDIMNSIVAQNLYGFCLTIYCMDCHKRPTGFYFLLIILDFPFGYTYICKSTQEASGHSAKCSSTQDRCKQTTGHDWPNFGKQEYGSCSNNSSDYFSSNPIGSFLNLLAFLLLRWIWGECHSSIGSL